MKRPNAIADPVDQVVHAWITAFNAGDLTAIKALYHPQAVLWGTTSPVLIDSSAGIHAYFTQVFGLQPPPRMTVGDMRVRHHGDTGIASGRYDLTLTTDSAPQTLPARFSFTCMRQDDGWLIVDHHSSWLPAPLAAEARS